MAVRPRWVHRGRSPLHGRGLFAACDIPAGTDIIEYTGRRITKAETDRIEARCLAARARGRDGCFYIFELNSRRDLDGNVPENEARFINHSCAPNCAPVDLSGRIWIVSLRDIPAVEELTYDYGFGYSEWRNHPCRCGAEGCIGHIVEKGQRGRVRKILAAESQPQRPPLARRDAQGYRRAPAPPHPGETPRPVSGQGL